MSCPQYDLMIIGAGVSGAALLYQAARFTDINQIAVIEKYAAPARVNSLSSNNSQTLHCGDIETNYTLEKALKVQRAARMLANYCLSQPDRDHLIFKYPKMVLGVGERECKLLRERYKLFQPHYPNLQLLEKKDIARIEPAVVARRDGKIRKEELVALGSTDEYTAVNFEALSCSFVRQAQAVQGKSIDVHYNECVKHIRIDAGCFIVETGSTCYRSRALVVCAGGHSLKLAHDLGYGLHYSCLPVAGSYYFTPQNLNGKVYTVQNDKLPFAAIHGDPDVLVPGKTRFGPTALILPILERYNYRTMPDFLRVFRFDRKVARVLWDLFRVTDIRNYMLKNILFEIPLLRKLLFLKDVRKIVPALRLRDLSFARKVGGIRPQLIDKTSCKLLMGEAKINPDNGVIFNMTPSPGGTSCLENAEIDMRAIAAFLGAGIDEAAFKTEMLGEDNEHDAGDFTGVMLDNSEKPAGRWTRFLKTPETAAMSILWEYADKATRYQVRRAGNSVRLYTNGVFHSQYNPLRPVSGNVWDLLMLPAFFYPAGSLRRVLVLGVGGGAVIQQLRRFVRPQRIVGVELSAVHLSVAERFFGVQGDDVELIEADARDWLMQYRGEPFDMIIDDLFGEEDGEPVRAVPADRGWVTLLLRQLATDGVITSNFATSADLEASAYRRVATLRRRFGAAFRLQTPQNYNAVGVFMRRFATTRQLRRRLCRVPEFDPRGAAARLDYRIRTLVG